ncbi:hypothetical protein BC830DRAFT_1175387 [Chytriomyces sp. MP71]|nr:hypothetical protein BC830DRAFT_1175387 [Chytriomyces sp. MP71]
MSASYALVQSLRTTPVRLRAMRSFQSLQTRFHSSHAHHWHHEPGHSALNNYTARQVSEPFMSSRFVGPGEMEGQRSRSYYYYNYRRQRRCGGGGVLSFAVKVGLLALIASWVLGTKGAEAVTEVDDKVEVIRPKEV